jgi:hypothetical protein
MDAETRNRFIRRNVMACVIRVSCQVIVTGTASAKSGNFRRPAIAGRKWPVDDATAM